MNQQVIIEKTAEYARKTLEGEGSGHDWWHVYRVWKSAVQIGTLEKANLLIVQLAALLHDIADYKFHGGDETIGPRKSREWLEQFNLKKDEIDHICEIVANISFKGAKAENKIKTKEGQVVQDADRLDAIGAIGIARTFAFGGSRGNPIHDPNVPPIVNQSIEEYKKSNHSQINHFYEKLLLLKDKMNTKTGKSIAENRHKFMELYLDRFFKEWEGKE